MAFIENTAFEARVTNNRFDDLVNIAGRYQENGEDAVCAAGILCVRGENLPCAGFAAQGIKNENAWYMEAAGADVTADDVIYAANTHDVNLATDASGNLYAIGQHTLGLPIPKGREGTFTKVIFDGEHQYRWGEGNLTGELGENQFLVPAAGGKLAPAAAAPTAAGSLYLKVTGTGKFVEGTSESFGYIQALACKVTVAGSALVADGDGDVDDGI